MTGLEIGLLVGLIVAVVVAAMGWTLFLWRCQSTASPLPSPSQPASEPSPEKIRRQARADRLRRAYEQLAEAEDYFDIVRAEERAARLKEQAEALERRVDGRQAGGRQQGQNP